MAVLDSWAKIKILTPLIFLSVSLKGYFCNECIRLKKIHQWCENFFFLQCTCCAWKPNMQFYYPFRFRIYEKFIIQSILWQKNDSLAIWALSLNNWEEDISHARTHTDIATSRLNRPWGWISENIYNLWGYSSGKVWLYNCAFIIVVSFFLHPILINWTNLPTFISQVLPINIVSLAFILDRS